MTQNQKIAKVIFEQLGGPKFKAMTGCRDLVAIEKGLRMRFAFNKRTEYLDITLNASDTYDLEFYRYNQSKFAQRETTGKFNSVFVDQLLPIIESETGLATSL